MTDLDQPGRVAIAQREAAHYREMADFYLRMATSATDALWEIAIALELPPQPAAELAGKTVVFGMYDIDRIAAKVRELNRPTISAASGSGRRRSHVKEPSTEG